MSWIKSEGAVARKPLSKTWRCFRCNRPAHHWRAVRSAYTASISL